MEIKRKIIFNKRQLKFLSHVMGKGGLENLILTRQVERKKVKGKQRLAYLMSFSKWMVEHGFREITTKNIKIYKGQDDVKRHDSLRSEGTRKKKSTVNALSTIYGWCLPNILYVIVWKINSMIGWSLFSLLLKFASHIFCCCWIYSSEFLAPELRVWWWILLRPIWFRRLKPVLFLDPRRWLYMDNSLNMRKILPWDLKTFTLILKTWHLKSWFQGCLHNSCHSIFRSLFFFLLNCLSCPTSWIVS